MSQSDPAAMPTAPARPVHAPYADRDRPFAIGLSPLDPDCWLEIDADLPRYLAEKVRLHAVAPDAVFAEEPGSRPAQAELLTAMLAHLATRHADTHRRDGAQVHIKGAPTPVCLDDGAPPLWTAARLVQEDLLLMERDDRGWRLTAGALCFPSSWSLGEKFGRPMADIHDGVPDFGPGARNARIIDRIFDSMTAEAPLRRRNWSIYEDGRLDHPVSKAGSDGVYRAADRLATPHVRVERQTLRKLPETGAIIFTVRIHVDPMETALGGPEGPARAAALQERIEELTPPQLAYKGLDDTKPALIDRLRAHRKGSPSKD